MDKVRGFWLGISDAIVQVWTRNNELWITFLDLRNGVLSIQSHERRILIAYLVIRFELRCSRSKVHYVHPHYSA